MLHKCHQHLHQLIFRLMELYLERPSLSLLRLDYLEVHQDQELLCLRYLLEVHQPVYLQMEVPQEVLLFLRLLELYLAAVLLLLLVYHW